MGPATAGAGGSTGSADGGRDGDAAAPAVQRLVHAGTLTCLSSSLVTSVSFSLSATAEQTEGARDGPANGSGRHQAMAPARGRDPARLEPSDSSCWRTARTK